MGTSGSTALPPCDHCGDPLPADLDFFAAAPPGIGALRSGWSTRRHGDPIEAPGWFSFFKKASTGTVTYVGAHGVAEATFEGTPDNHRMRVYCFEDDAQLSATERSVPAAPGRREYGLSWCGPLEVGPDDRPTVAFRFRIDGSHECGAALPPPGDRYHFTRAAERAWAAWHLPRLPRDDHGAVSLGCSVSDVRTNRVRIGPRFLELDLAEGRVHLDANEVVSVGLVRQDGHDECVLSLAAPLLGPVGGDGRIAFCCTFTETIRLALTDAGFRVLPALQPRG